MHYKHMIIDNEMGQVGETRKGAGSPKTAEGVWAF